jgi:biotin transport system substrate-specific component
VPVFSGFTGGISILLGVTGGYIAGFLFTALIVGLAVRKFGRGLPILIISMILGILVCYAFGTAWFMTIYAAKTGPIGLGTALSWCVFPYLLPDAAKIVLASVLTGRLYPVLNREVKAA